MTDLRALAFFGTMSAWAQSGGISFHLDGLVAERAQALRIKWDSVIASRTPPHVSLACLEEVTDESLLVERARRPQ